MTTQNSKATFETFNSGICSIRLMDEDGNAAEERERLRYQERTVGIKRYYEAMTAKLQVDKVIRVPKRPWLTTEYLVVMDGRVYEIIQAQMIFDSLPECTDLSLHLTRQRKVTSQKGGRHEVG